MKQSCSDNELADDCRASGFYNGRLTVLQSRQRSGHARAPCLRTLRSRTNRFVMAGIGLVVFCVAGCGGSDTNRGEKNAAASSPRGRSSTQESVSQTAKSIRNDVNRSKDQTADRTKIFFDDHEGFAGNISRNNIYDLNVETTADHHLLHLWVNPRRNAESYGDVVLTGPDGNSRTIYSWSETDFAKTFGKVESHEEFEPIDVDVSEHVKSPGHYKVEFQYQTGREGVFIYRVQLDVTQKTN